VEVSPSSRPSTMSRSSRRMILPLRVFGNSGTTWISFGRAIGEISRATSRAQFVDHVFAVVAGVRLQDHPGDDRLAGVFVGGADDGGLGPRARARPTPIPPLRWKCGARKHSSRRRCGPAPRCCRQGHSAPKTSPTPYPPRTPTGQPCALLLAPCYAGSPGESTRTWPVAGSMNCVNCARPPGTRRH
jgi:hypothetical protein